MKFAQILVENQPLIIASESEGEWRELDIAHDLYDVINTSTPEIEAAYKRGKPVNLDAVRILAPLMPGKIIAVGHNYMDHIREQNATVPSRPLLFVKVPSAVIGPDMPIEWDPNISSAVDYEAELAVIIGAETRRVAPEHILKHIFGYTVVNDVTARDLQKSDGQWARAKGMDTFCPMGPFVVSADEVPNVQNLNVRSTVNGEMRQNSNTKEMIFDVKTLISYMSQVFTLNPGDVILTGTPDGVGFYRKPQATLQDGDEVIVEVEGIGRLRNVCRTL